MVSIIKKHTNFTALIVIACMVLIGLIVLASSYATTRHVSSEAEAGTRDTGTVLIADGTASGGYSVRFKSSIQYGYAAHVLSQTDRQQYLQMAKAAGATTVRADFLWTTANPQKGVYDWNGIDEVMRLTAPLGLQVLGIADYAPDWASSCPQFADKSKCGPVDAADYGKFAGRLADRYRAGGAFWKENPQLPYVPLAGIEIWNEPNLGIFWADPNGTAYTRSLKAAYTAIKQVDPTIKVIAGAMAAAGSDLAGQYFTPQTFLNQMYGAGAKGYFDAISHHPYSYYVGGTAAFMISPQAASGWAQLTDMNPSIRSIMVANGDGNKKIWLTEMGAPTSTGGVSEGVQADLAKVSVAKWKTYPWAGNYYWYDVRDDCADAANKECRFGIYRRDNTKKPAFNTIVEAYR